MVEAVDYRHNGGPEISDDIDYADREGFVAIARKVRQHPIVGFGNAVKPANPDEGAYSRYEAWCDLIMECKYRAGRVRNGGKVMTLQPGQLVGAVSWLASRWNWSPKTVRTFLDALEGDGMIERGYAEKPISEGERTKINPGTTSGKHNGKQAHVLTICKYELFQLANRHQGQIKGQGPGQMKGKSGANEGQQYKEEQGNKGTKEQIITSQQEEVAGAPIPIVGGAVLAGPNEFSEKMLAHIQQWMNLADPLRARDWLATSCHTYGQSNVSDAYAKLTTDMALGKVIANPMATWGAIAQRLRDERKSKPQKSPVKPWMRR